MISSGRNCSSMSSLGFPLTGLAKPVLQKMRSLSMAVRIELLLFLDGLLFTAALMDRSQEMARSSYAFRSAVENRGRCSVKVTPREDRMVDVLRLRHMDPRRSFRFP